MKMNLVPIREIRIETAISDKPVTCGFFAQLIPEAPEGASNPP